MFLTAIATTEKFPLYVACTSHTIILIILQSWQLLRKTFVGCSTASCFITFFLALNGFITKEVTVHLSKFTLFNIIICFCIQHILQIASRSYGGKQWFCMRFIGSISRVLSWCFASNVVFPKCFSSFYGDFTSSLSRYSLFCSLFFSKFVTSSLHAILFVLYPKALERSTLQAYPFDISQFSLMF